MSMNEEMNELGSIGSSQYDANDQVVSHLVTRTRRRRTLRQSAAAGIGSVSAIVLALVGAQVMMSFENEDPAFRDRNLIDAPIPVSIFDFENKYGSDYTGTDTALKDKIEALYEELEVAAKVKARKLAEKEAAAEAAAKKAAAEAAAAAAAEKEKTTTPTTTAPACEDYDHPDKPYKYWDCDAEEWKIKDNWNEYGGAWGECKWYEDKATGTEFYAAYIISGWHKLVLCDGTDKYRYVQSSGGTVKATMDGLKCVGNYEDGSPSSQPKRYSCNPDKSEWIADSSFVWFEFGWFIDGCDDKGWYDKHKTIEYEGRTFAWDGDWYEVTT